MNKTNHALELMRKALIQHTNIAVACSFGKDSMVAVDIARTVDPNIPIFSIMTEYKPKETFEYLVEMDKKMNLNTTVYMVADHIPPILLENGIKTILLSTEEFHNAQKEVSPELYRMSLINVANF